MRPKPNKPSSNNPPIHMYGENVRFDYDSIIKARYAAHTTTRVNIKVTNKDHIIMDDPYSLHEKVSFEQSWRYDPIVRLAINKKVDFIVGERPINVLDTKKEFSGNPEAAAQAFNNVAGNKVYQEMKEWIDNLHSKVKYHEKLKAAMVSMKIYGRAALHIEKFGDLCPADLKLLNSQNLGEVIVKNGDWNLYAVRYNDLPNEAVKSNSDFERDDNVIYADEIIYFTNLNYNITPDTLWYGYSEVEPIVHVSECNRQIDMTDLKEINAKLWGAYGIIKFLESKDPTAMQKWLNDFKPGTWMATDANIEVDLHELKSSLKDLIEERDKNDLRILRAIGVPSFLAGFESITNRATVKSILESWKVSTINPERAMLKNIIEPQWLNTLVAYYLGTKKMPAIGVKIKQEFQDIVFETVKDNVESYLPLFEQGLITGYQLLRLVGLDYLADEAKAVQNHMLQQTEQLKADIALRIDQLLGHASPTGDLKSNIEVKMLRDNLVNDIDARIKGEINGTMNSFIEHAIYRKMIKDKFDAQLEGGRV